MLRLICSSIFVKIFLLPLGVLATRRGFQGNTHAPQQGIVIQARSLDKDQAKESNQSRDIAVSRSVVVDSHNVQGNQNGNNKEKADKGSKREGLRREGSQDQNISGSKKSKRKHTGGSKSNAPASKLNAPAGVFELGTHAEGPSVLEEKVEPEKGINEFLKSKADIPEDAKKVLGVSLLNGVRRANFMKSSEWDEDKLLLTVELETTGKLVGEIATASNMPIFLSLEKHLKFSFDKKESKMIVSLTGVHTEPSKQGIGLYEALMNYNGLDLEQSTLEDRKRAAKEYLFAVSGSKWSRKWKHFGNFNTDGKIRKILESKFNPILMRNVINKAKDWGFVFLSMCVVPPMTITNMVFENGLVYFESMLKPTQDHRYQKYGFRDMTEVLAQEAILGAGTLEAQYAKSALNFARASVAKQAEKIKAADPASIGNMIAYCEGSKPGQDPKCRKPTPGRVSWGDSEPASMTASAFFK